jgi:hypothetical protein
MVSAVKGNKPTSPARQINSVRFMLFKITAKRAGTPLTGDKEFITFCYIANAMLQ